MFILICTPVIGYNQYFNGNLQLGKVRGLINQVPSKYFRGLSSIYLFEGNCDIQQMYLSGVIQNNGYFYYEYKIHNGRIHNSRSEIYLCNLGQYKYNGDEYGLLGTIYHEVGHLYQFNVLEQINLSEEFANTFTNDW